MLIEKIRAAFIIPSAPVDADVREDRVLHTVVSERSHGNVRLQKGKFFTKKDTDEQYNRIKHTKFADS